MSRPVVVLGFLGTTLDVGSTKRWERWRPSVDLCRHDDLVVSRFELLHPPVFERLSRQVAADIEQVSPETQVRLRAFEVSDPWDLQDVYAVLLDFCRAYPFDPEREDYLVHITTGTHVLQICLFLLVESNHIPGRLVQTSPPPKRSLDPGTYRIIDLDLRQYEQLASRFARERRDDLSFLKEGIETRNAEFNALVERMEMVAVRSRAPLLLTGPTGAGKTRLARRLYELKSRRRQVRGRFVEVNCATLRGDTAMSTLFGHAKGAFTGASSERRGLLKAADGGVLFLDEIGELGADEQAMLLSALEDRRFTPLGSDVEIHSDFQLIAGTNRDLRSRVAQGRFREDLLARIDLWSFELPGLARRPEDIEPNLDYELDRLEARDGGRLTMTRRARQRFVQWACSPAATWPGNFRDFSATVERMATLAGGGRISEADVEREIEHLGRRWKTSRDEDVRPMPRVEQALGSEGMKALDRFDRVQLADVLDVCARSRTLSEAGRSLFEVSRLEKSSSNDADRLRKYLARFGLSWRTLPR